MIYENWIDETNLKPALTAIGGLCRCRFSETDWETVSLGITAVDEDAALWYPHTMKGDFEIRVFISKLSGSSNYSLKIESDRDIKQALEAITDIAQSFRIVDFA